MQVIAEEPWGWFLFEEDRKLYLDVLVEHGAISYSVAAELSVQEAADYAQRGVTALSTVVGTMRHQALMRQWKIQPLPPGWNERSVAAVHEWQKRKSD